MDEFLIVPQQSLHGAAAALRGRDTFLLHDLLGVYEQDGVGAVLIHRLHFGSSGHIAPPEGLVMQAYTQRLVHLHRNATPPGKVLAKSAAVLRQMSAHEPPLMQPGWRAATADGAPLSHGSAAALFEPLRLHHYVTRSFSECMAKAMDERNRGTWREVAGRETCERHMRGSPAHH